MDTTDDYNSISIYKLKEWNFIPLNDRNFFTNAGTLRWSSWRGESTVSVGVYKYAGEAYIVFNYTATDRQTGEAESVHHRFDLVSTPCNFGGSRYWFSCYCGKRVGFLYIDGKHIGCRNCFHLTYETRNITRGGEFEGWKKALDYNERIIKLDEKIKVPYYNGKPTRKQRQLESLVRKYQHYAQALSTGYRKRG